MTAINTLIIYVALEASDIALYWGTINSLARICMTVSKLSYQISCGKGLNSLNYIYINLHIYYPFLLIKVGLID